MERGSKIIISIIVAAVISALVIAYYQSTSTKVVGAQCDKTKKICQVQSETTHFGGYFPIYSYYYVPFPLFGPGLGLFYPGSFIRPNVCDDCLSTVTPQDEQQVLNSKTPVPQSDLLKVNLEILVNNRHLQLNLLNLHHPLLNRHHQKGVVVQVERVVVAVPVLKVAAADLVKEDSEAAEKVVVAAKISNHFG
jgi:flagellar basal body-associated protein FliL